MPCCCVQGRLVAIDACVQRRPPGAKVCAEDAACNQMAELVLNDLEVAALCMCLPALSGLSRAYLSGPPPSEPAVSNSMTLFVI